MQTSPLSRRALLQTALGGGAFFLLPHMAAAQSVASTGETRPFSFDMLTAKARDLAKKPWQAATIPDADVLEKIDYDNHNRIRFRSESALWHGQERRSAVQMFFPGRYFQQPVRIFAVEDGVAAEVPFSLDLFEIPDGNPAHDLTHTRGFAGFRVLDQTSDRDWMAFLGASYWRTSGYSGQFGLSARGLAIDTAIPEGAEEFPLFTSFWLEPGADGDMTAYALLDSPGATGAYRIASTRGQGVVQNVTARIFLRRDVERLGVAPLTSMYWFGKLNRQTAPDWRPEVHDSDGLEIVTGTGEQIWRPLNNPPHTMVNSFGAPGLKGFGLMQRERDFEQYQDDGVFYERRASAWVVPGGDWGDGSVMLVELRTDDEIHDNIVAFWNPAEPAKAGAEHEFSYTLSWLQDGPLSAATGRFSATRIGAGGIPGQPRPENVVKIVCDFTAGDLSRDKRPDLHLNASRGGVTNPAVYPIVDTEEWRAIFDLDFAEIDHEDDTPIDIRAYVADGDRAITETLLLQLFPSQLRDLLDSAP